jgi:flagellar protein FliS
MAAYQNPAHKYREIAVKTANPLQLVVMLYDAAITCMQEAQAHVHNKNISGRARAINKCISIISELQSCLDLKAGGEIASSLNRLYDYMKRRIFTANVEQSAQPLMEVEGLLGNLRSAWTELIAKSNAATTPQPMAGNPMPNAGMMGSNAPTPAVHKSFNFSV